MELLVLDTLEWKLNSVTPFAYLSYFASKFNFDHCSKDLFSKAISFIFDILEGDEFLLFFLPNMFRIKKNVIFMHLIPIPAVNLMDYRPSAIAAAAILAASGDRLTKKSLESKITSVSLSESLEIVSYLVKYPSFSFSKREQANKYIYFLILKHYCLLYFLYYRNMSPRATTQ